MISYDDPQSPAYTLWIARLQTNYTAYQAVQVLSGDAGAKSHQRLESADGRGPAVGGCGWRRRLSRLRDGSSVAFVGSYALNGWCYSQMGYPQCFDKESAVTSPSQTPYFADSIWAYGWPGDLLPASDLYAGADNASMQRFTIARHGWRAPATAPHKLAARGNLSGQDQHWFCGWPCRGRQTGKPLATSIGTKAGLHRPRGPSR